MIPVLSAIGGLVLGYMTFRLWDWICGLPARRAIRQINPYCAPLSTEEPTVAVEPDGDIWVTTTSINARDER